MNEESIRILKILTDICKNFNIDEEGTEKAMGYFREYLPKQNVNDLREMLIQIHNDMKAWDGQSDGVEVIHKLYTNITKGLKDTPLSGRAGNFMRGFIWHSTFKRSLKRPEYQPMIYVTIGDIKRDLEGYVSEKEDMP